MCRGSRILSTGETMKQRSSILAASAAMILLAACTQAPPPVPDTREADAKAIRDAENASLAAFKMKDVDKGSMLWADDATLAVTNMPLLNGHAPILAWLKDAVGDPNFSIDYASTTVEVAKSGEYGWSR